MESHPALLMPQVPTNSNAPKSPNHNGIPRAAEGTRRTGGGGAGGHCNEDHCNEGITFIDWGDHPENYHG